MKITVSSVLHHLRHDAKSWWYHAELRRVGRTSEAIALERRAMKGSLRVLKEARKGGFAILGLGGNRLVYESEFVGSKHSSTLSGFDRNFAGAIIAAGIPTLDLTEIRETEYEEFERQTMRGPMAGLADDPFGSDPEGSFSTVHWTKIFDRRHKLGATVYNYTPNTE